MTDVVLRATGVVKHFRTHKSLLARSGHRTVRAVDGISLELHRGETLGIVGESGCGKSTLARLLVALETPSAGSVQVQGRDIHALRPRARRRARRDIQLVMQDPYTSLNPRMTVGAIVAEPFAIHPDVAPRGRRRQETLDLLDLVGLNPDHANRYPYQFSGGQRQRIGIARALALRPAILVLDEPVSTLDVSVQAQVINLLQQLQNDLGLSYVFIAHDLSVVRHVSDRVAVMYLGKVVETGADAEIYDEAAHPYTQALLSAVPVPDPVRQGARQRIVLRGDVPSPTGPPSGCRFRGRCRRAEDRCAEAEPLLRTIAPRHEAACHFADVPVSTSVDRESV
ncbi:ABC transporter ATP-binding protein [Micromonosporaceae bacterium Da 78-11]